MPRYSREGKITNPLSDQEFLEGMNQGKFVQEEHKGLVALLHYSGIRLGEALNLTVRDTRLTPEYLYLEIKRLKHSKTTPPIPIPLGAPYVSRLVYAINRAKEGGSSARIFPYCRKTGYNVVTRVFKYPHYHRLSRITWFFMPHPELGKPSGYSIAEVKAWTGLTLTALDFYVGLVSVGELGKALGGSSK